MNETTATEQAQSAPRIFNDTKVIIVCLGVLGVMQLTGCFTATHAGSGLRWAAVQRLVK